MLRRRLSHPPPLSPSLARIAARLASRPPRPAEAPDAIWAAVAFVLVAEPDALLLIRRAERAGDPWSGQMGLPGGRHHPGDPDLLATAIRETEEEVGLALDASRCIGVLDDVAPRTPDLPPIAVRPFVFSLAGRPALTLNPEVASAHWVELRGLQRPDSVRPFAITLRGEERTFPAYQIEDLVVWGMTERIISGFIQVVFP